MFSSGVGMTSPEALDRVEASRWIRAGPTPLPGAGLRQLQEVMGAAHETLLLCHLLDPAQPHRPKPSRLFDLAEDELHSLLAHPISTAMITPSSDGFRRPRRARVVAGPSRQSPRI